MQSSDLSISTNDLSAFDPSQLTLGKRLGSGSYGSVYEGTYRNTKVAVKVLNKPTEKSVANFEKEYGIMARLKHPNIVDAIGYFQSDQDYHIVMECMEKDLSNFLYSHSLKKISWVVRRHFILDIAEGVAFLHRRKLAHKDLKPLNILLDAKNRVKIGDFGCSNFITNNSTFGTPAGTLCYLSPEHIIAQDEGGRIKGLKGDVYSFTIMFWEICSRKKPWERAGISTLVQNVINGERPPIGETFPPQFVSIIKRGWAQDPEDRPTMDEIVQLLQDNPLPYTEKKFDGENIHDPKEQLRLLNEITAGDNMRKVSFKGWEILTDELLIPVLKNLPNLIKLDLSDCSNLSLASLQAAATFCPRLSVLSIQNWTQLVYLPDLVFPSLTFLQIDNCSNLEFLTLNTRLDFLSATGCTNLKKINGNLPALKDLFLDGCTELDGSSLLNFIAKCQDLQKLIMDGHGLQNLQKLTMDGCDIQKFGDKVFIKGRNLTNDDFIPILKDLPNLVSLHLDDCANLDAISLQAIAASSYPQLRDLSIRNWPQLISINNLDFPSLTSLKMDNCCNLESLTLNAPSLTSLSLEECIDLTKIDGKLPALRELFFGNCTKIDVPSLFSFISNCQYFHRLATDAYDLKKNGDDFFFKGHEILTDEILIIVLKNSRNLTEIDLSDCPNLSLASLQAITTFCPQLRVLTIQNWSKLVSIPNLDFTSLISLKVDNCCNLKSVAFNAPVLTSLSLEGCINLKKIRGRLPALRELFLDKCTKIRTSSLLNFISNYQDFKKLTTERYDLQKTNDNIFFKGRKTLTDESLVRILKRLPNLATLDLSGCINLSSASLHTIAKLCPKLYSLTIQNWSQIVSLPKFDLRSLLHLNMDNCCNLESLTLNTPNLDSLSLINCTNLKKINGYSVSGSLFLDGCTELEASSFLDFIKNCYPGLRKLTMVGYDFKKLSKHYFSKNSDETSEKTSFIQKAYSSLCETHEGKRQNLNDNYSLFQKAPLLMTSDPESFKGPVFNAIRSFLTSKTTVLSLNELCINKTNINVIVKTLNSGFVTQLNLINNQYEWDCFGLIMKAIGDNPSIIAIKICDQHYSPNSEAIAKALNNHSITSLNIQNNSFTDEGVENLRKSIIAHPSIAKITFKNTMYGHRLCRIFASALALAPNLKTINFRNNYIKKVRPLFKAIGANHSITHVNLRENRILGGRDSEAIAEAISANPSLTLLNLEYNLICDWGTQKISESLKNHHALTHINLGSNGITSTGLEYLSEALKVNCSVTSIFLHRNWIQNWSVEVFTNALKSNSENRVQRINLARNRISDIGARAISSVLAHSRLSSIDLSGNWIGFAEAQFLVETLANNRSISPSINLSNNWYLEKYQTVFEKIWTDAGRDLNELKITWKTT